MNEFIWYLICIYYVYIYIHIHIHTHIDIHIYTVYDNIICTPIPSIKCPGCIPSLVPSVETHKYLALQPRIKQGWWMLILITPWEGPYCVWRWFWVFKCLGQSTRFFSCQVSNCQHFVRESLEELVRRPFWPPDHPGCFACPIFVGISTRSSNNNSCAIMCSSLSIRLRNMSTTHSQKQDSPSLWTYIYKGYWLYDHFVLRTKTRDLFETGKDQAPRIYVLQG